MTNMNCNCKEQKQLMSAVTQFGFALSDITLYLDTHPEDAEALNYYNHMNRMYKKARSEYAQKFGPITQFDGQETDSWKWAQQTWPWERGFY